MHPPARSTARGLSKIAAVACSLSAIALSTALSNPMLHAADGRVVDEQDNAVLLRCVNLSPWLIPEGYLMAQASWAGLTTSPSQIRERLTAVVGAEQAAAFWHSWTQAFVDAADFQDLKSRGFNCARLPLSAKFLTSQLEAGAVRFDAAGIAPVDNAVAWGAASGIYVILDLHDAPGGQDPLASVSDVRSNDRVARLWEGPTAAENKRKTIALWQALATRYAQARSVGGYDLLNEPELPAKVAVTDLTELYRSIIAAIRAVDSDHMVVLEGNHYAHDFSMLNPPPDQNLLYEFHEYTLFNRAWRNPTQNSLAPYLQLRETTRKPIWLGEFGESTFAWQKQVVELAKANGVGWAIWPWKRIDLKNDHPVIETIEAPEAWRQVAGYLVGAWLTRQPAPRQLETAMAQMLQAIRSSNCREDLRLEKALAGE